MTHNSILLNQQNVGKNTGKEDLSECESVALPPTEKGSFFEPKSRNKIRTFLGGLVDPV
jgi:hypothetical protein